MLGRTQKFLAVLLSLHCAFTAVASANDFSIAEHPLLKFRSSNETLKVGDSSATLFIAADVSFPKDEVVLSATLDGAPLALSKAASALWLAALPVFHEVKTHLIEVRVSIRRAQEAKRIQDAIQANDLVIFDLNQKIAVETDPVKLAALQALRTEKLALKARLEAELAALAIFLKAETINGQPQRVLGSESTGWRIETPSLAQGVSTLSLSSFLGPKRETRKILEAIDVYWAELHRIDRELELETDPAKIEQLVARRGRLRDLSARASERLKQIRRPIGNLVQKRLHAN